MLKYLLAQKTVTTLDYVQMITRVSDLKCTELFAKRWWPEVDCNMQFMEIPERYKLPKYVLHAKHGSIDKGSLNLSALFGTGFADIC